MMIQMFDRPNTTPIGQDRKTLTLKALLSLRMINKGPPLLLYKKGISLKNILIKTLKVFFPS